MRKLEYIPTIGLEVHAELKTRTKMFCNSANDPDEKRPNVNICPVCMAHPGTLPVINKEAVKHVLRVGVALGSTLADFTEFDRKNYFYPDIPKGYQISQYKFPLVSGGSLNGVAITRVHLEEDTARSVHDEKLAGKDYTLLDFNRAGVPLMELVTEPVIHDAKTAGNFARELQLLLRYLGASEANMEKGEMRVEANVSVQVVGGRGKGERPLGTKVEVKNLNSFRSVERAIEYEIKRQIKELESGGKVVQETRGWDEGKQQTYPQRSKELAHDYRYFPEPDLPKLKLSEIPEFHSDELRKTMPEPPWEKRARYKKEFGLKTEDIETIVADPCLAEFFEAVSVKLAGQPRFIILVVNYLTSDVIGIIRKKEGEGVEVGEVLARSKLSPDNFTEAITLLADGKISSRGAKDLLTFLFRDGGKAAEIAKEKGLMQKSDEGELRTIVEKVIDENAQVVAQYRGGKTASLQFLVGQAMKAAKGTGNPQAFRKLFEEMLK